MGGFKFFKNLLHLFCVNIYKQDFPHSLIHLVKAFRSSATCPEVIQKLILQSSGYITGLQIKI